MNTALTSYFQRKMRFNIKKKTLSLKILKQNKTKKRKLKLLYTLNNSNRDPFKPLAMHEPMGESNLILHAFRGLH